MSSACSARRGRLMRSSMDRCPESRNGPSSPPPSTTDQTASATRTLARRPWANAPARPSHFSPAEVMMMMLFIGTHSVTTTLKDFKKYKASELVALIAIW